jgi:hypothetical protein
MDIHNLKFISGSNDVTIAQTALSTAIANGGATLQADLMTNTHVPTVLPLTATITVTFFIPYDNNQTTTQPIGSTSTSASTTKYDCYLSNSPGEFMFMKIAFE